MEGMHKAVSGSSVASLENTQEVLHSNQIMPVGVAQKLVSDAQAAVSEGLKEKFYTGK